MFLGFIGLATLIVCILLGRYNRERVAREWDMALGRRMHESVDALERRCRIDRMMADDSWDAAWEAMVVEEGSRAIDTGGSLERARRDMEAAGVRLVRSAAAL